MRTQYALKKDSSLENGGIDLNDLRFGAKVRLVNQDDFDDSNDASTLTRADF